MLNKIVGWFKSLFVKPKLIRRYNWVKDTPDKRDVKFKYKVMRLPAAVDLRPKCPPVVNQGDLGSCTANALAGGLGFLELQEIAEGEKNDIEEFTTPGFTPFSRLFIYWNERVIEGDTSEDNGAQLRDGIKSLATTGACSEVTWPYNVKYAFKVPTPASFTEASKHKITSYQSLNGTSLTDLKSCLAQGYPFAFGFTVYASFESETVATNGIMPMPSPAEECLGGHAVLCVGYDDTKKTFTVRNSWGSDWGDEGYFYMPYDYMSNADLTSDHWTIRK
jgi:C1A family cysteine protease